MKRVGFLTLILFLLSASAHPTYAQSNLRITGTVVGISGRLAGHSRPLTLIVNRYTSPAEVADLTQALGHSEDEMLRVLRRMNVGRIQLGYGVGVTANAIIAEPWENGTRLRILYDRNVNIYELRYGTRSSDYRFGYAELFLDQNGKGQGTLIPAARLRLTGGNTWEVEDFGAFPARVMGLRANGRVTAK